MRIAVLGAGAWGTAIAIRLAARHEVSLWSRTAERVAALREQRSNRRYLPGFDLPASIHPEESLGKALDGAKIALAAVATGGLRELLRGIRATGSTAPLVCLSKGFEGERVRLPHEVCAEELASGSVCTALSGPSFAQEVARGLPAAVVLAAANLESARALASELHDSTLRVYASDDLPGVETAGAVKNVIAIAAGVSDGLELGANARAALITRGLAEITRLGVALGARPETFMGLAGLGDLVLTCTSDLSRNRRVGLALARGERLEAVFATLGHVAEGVGTARAVAALAREHNVEMPITHAVCRVLENPASARAAVQDLLSRQLRSEH